MASQRIVLTSPWKLGLFVFLLVVGCGFGLIYAYLRYLGGSVDFTDEQSLRAFYIVCASVAGLGILGYVSVIASARPMVGMAKNKQRREKLLKKFGQIKDVRRSNPDDFSAEPALAQALERWIEATRAVDEAEQAAQAQRETIAELTQQLENEAGTSQVASEPAAIAENRQQLEFLAEESNRLAIQAALQISRVEDPSDELKQLTDDIRALSSSYQRVASELRVLESDDANQQELEQPAAASPVVEAPDEIAESGPAEVISAAPEAAVIEPTAIAPEPVAASQTPQKSQEAAPVVLPEQPQGSEQVFELDELGGRELDESGEPIYDLKEFEAVEL